MTEQTDRELLEAAAKAAGMTHLIWTPGASPIVPAGHRATTDRTCWNPLTDDGDALRLAANLHMTLRIYMGNACAQIGVPGQTNAYIDESNHADPCAATRRAITRAAAAIGEAMQ